MLAFRPDENIKVCSVLVFCQRAELLRSVPEPQWSTERRVSGLQCHCPRTSGTIVSRLWLTDPRHAEPLSPWMTYTQPLARPADVGSLQLNTCWVGGEAGYALTHSGQQVKASLLQVSGRLWSSWPGELKTTLRFPPHRGCVRRSGQRTGSCRVDSRLITLPDKTDSLTAQTLQSFWRLLALTWCTQSPEVPANLLHNGGQVSECVRYLKRDAMWHQIAFAPWRESCGSLQQFKRVSVGMQRVHR